MLCSVVGVDIVSSSLGGVHWVTSIARSRLREAKGDTNIRLELSSGCGGSNEVADVTKDPLPKKHLHVIKLIYRSETYADSTLDIVSNSSNLIGDIPSKRGKAVKTLILTFKILNV